MSETSTIPAKLRDRAGKGAARATRREGLVPCIVYGANKEPSMISMDPRVIWKGLEGGHFYSTVYTIEVEGGSKEQVLARDIQFHPVTDQPLHVDFVRVSKKTQVTVNVPVVFANEEECVGAREGGIINVIRHELELSCSAGDIPAEIVFDMTNVAIGDTVRVSDMPLPEGVESAITDRDPVVVNVVPPKTAAAEEAEGEEEEGAEEAAADEAAEEEATEE